MKLCVVITAVISVLYIQSSLLWTLLMNIDQRTEKELLNIKSGLAVFKPRQFLFFFFFFCLGCIFRPLSNSSCDLFLAFFLCIFKRVFPYGVKHKLV